MTKKALVLVLFLGSVFSIAAVAASSLARFEGGIGVISVRGNAPPFAANVVQGVSPAGVPWVIARLSADVKLDGRISVDGRGLLLAGGNNIGRSGGQSVRAKLLCGGVAFDSALAPLDAAGDFRIEDTLVPAPPDPCVNAVLLIVNAGNSWFAAGIPKD